MRLRAVIEADLPLFFEHQRDPEAATMAAFPPRDREAFMTHWHDRVLGNPESMVRTIDVDGEVAGNVVSWQPAEGERAIGYYLGRAYWGRGIATAALAAFLASHEKRRPLVAHVAEHNVASRRVLEKCGFEPTGKPEVSDDGVVERVLRLDG